MWITVYLHESQSRGICENMRNTQSCMNSWEYGCGRCKCKNIIIKKRHNWSSSTFGKITFTHFEKAPFTPGNNIHFVSRKYFSLIYSNAYPEQSDRNLTILHSKFFLVFLRFLLSPAVKGDPRNRDCKWRKERKVLKHLLWKEKWEEGIQV